MICLTSLARTMDKAVISCSLVSACTLKPGVLQATRLQGRSLWWRCSRRWYRRD